jgi:hypothetical protein
VTAIERSITVAAPADAVMAVLLDVASYPSWQREVARVEVAASDAAGRPVVATTWIRALGRAGSYTVRYSYPGLTVMRYELVEADMMSRHDGVFTVVDRGGSSELTVSLDIALKWPVPGPIVATFTRKGVADMLRAVKGRAEA